MELKLLYKIMIEIVINNTSRDRTIIDSITIKAFIKSFVYGTYRKNRLLGNRIP